MVQDILSDMSSDEVNSIEDTTEALQVAQIIKSCYFEMIGNRNWPHLKKPIQLEHAGDIARPNYLKLPVNLKELTNFKYYKTAISGSQRYDNVTLNDTGEFYDSFRVVRVGTSIKITAETMKEDNDLIQVWGKDILGLTDENLQKVIDAARIFLIPRIKEKILRQAA